MHGRDISWRLQLMYCRPQHARADHQQQHTESERSSVLETLMTVGMILIGVFAAVMTRKQHHEIGDQIRERMDTVGDQALRLGHAADHDLDDGQRQIHSHTHPGAAQGGGAALLGAVLRVFGVVGEISEFHELGAALSANYSCPASSSPWRRALHVENDERDFTRGPRLIVELHRLLFCHALPPHRALGTAERARHGRRAEITYLYFAGGLCKQVQIPDRMLRQAALGADDDDFVVAPVVLQDGIERAAGFAADMVQQ